MDPYSGGSWTMIPTHNSTPTQSNQDALFVHQQQQQQFLQQQQQPFQQQQQLQLYQQQQQRLLLQQQQQQQQQHQQHQSLASHFHLLQLVENLAEVVEHGTRDQQSDALVNDLSSHFEKCQQLLNSISVSLSSKAMTVEGQKKKLEESEQLLSQRRDLFAKYRNSVEELIKSEP
ncbi:Mediator of RNA polymerase II transcription subunit 9 [Quillaja saponaria]|uniref:Mediator of RNA polymerase II transcription subunit 9 n=1 Tax=Quillaja saponaria TaxID=32244 RepID=A0AAD7LTN5_QUISA|nr:Mediator of RNA polymerase II transcription subunit 9 [Quillaja saponaria]